MTKIKAKSFLVGIDCKCEVGGYYDPSIKMCNLHESAPDLLLAGNRAMIEISKDWERCDLGTGEGCPGIICHVGAHRALKIIESACAKVEE